VSFLLARIGAALGLVHHYCLADVFVHCKLQLADPSANDCSFLHTAHTQGHKVITSVVLVAVVVTIILGLYYLYKRTAGQVQYIRIVYVTLATDSTMHDMHQLVFSAYCSTAAHCWPLK
jgi:hypothetical protein